LICVLEHDLENGRLRHPDGPAVEWKSGTSSWFWEGLHVRKRIAARSSERARLHVLVRTRDVELSRLLFDRIGYERFLDIAGTELVAQDDFGKPWLRADAGLIDTTVRLVHTGRVASTVASA
jgi:hypothetical protein